jgi:hypothetical protein
MSKASVRTLKVVLARSGRGADMGAGARGRDEQPGVCAK